jgi:hypothetical protein
MNQVFSFQILNLSFDLDAIVDVEHPCLALSRNHQVLAIGYPVALHDEVQAVVLFYEEILLLVFKEYK